MGKPVIPTSGHNPNKPVVVPPERAYWQFSFKDYQQIPNFQLGSSNHGWFTSLFDKFREYNRIEKKEIDSNTQLRDQLRYHPIDWRAKNCPLARSEFSWLESDILDNDEEFPFYQFQISTALGRIVGYWQANIFHILLLDPLHNIQPSKRNNYKIRPTHTSESDISALLSSIEEVKNLKCESDKCVIKNGLNNMNLHRVGENAVIAFLSKEDFEIFEAHSEEFDMSISNIITWGLYHL